MAPAPGPVAPRPRWKVIVRRDPDLWRLHKRSRLVVPGAIGIGVGGIWLLTSTAWELDHYTAEGGNWPYKPPTAVDALWRWVIPAAIVGGGVAMTLIGVRANRKLQAKRARLYAAPMASRRGGGLTLGGRF